MDDDPLVAAAREDARQEILTDTLVAKIIKTFPGSEVAIFENNDNDREID